jgi:hypothetical protein
MSDVAGDTEHKIDFQRSGSRVGIDPDLVVSHTPMSLLPCHSDGNLDCRRCERDYL